MEGLIFGILRYRTWAIEDHVPRGLAAGVQVCTVRMLYILGVEAEFLSSLGTFQN